MKKKELGRETAKVLFIGILLFILRWLPTNIYNKLLNSLMNTIHKEVFVYHAKDFVDIVKFSYSVSQKYKDAIAEYESLKGQFVVLKPVYPMLFSNVKNYRNKVGLLV